MGHPSFRKEGKVLIYNILLFSSSSEEEYSRLVGREVVHFKKHPIYKKNS
jgi:hypothetical protein